MQQSFRFWNSGARRYLECIFDFVVVVVVGFLSFHPRSPSLASTERLSEVQEARREEEGPGSGLIHEVGPLLLLLIVVGDGCCSGSLEMQIHPASWSCFVSRYVRLFLSYSSQALSSEQCSLLQRERVCFLYVMMDRRNMCT